MFNSGLLNKINQHEKKNALKKNKRSFYTFVPSIS